MDLKHNNNDLFCSSQFNSQRDTNELATIARRHGFEPLYEQFMSSNNNSKWANRDVFFTNKNEIHNTDFHDDNHNHTFCYLCSINQHEHERTKPRDESQRRKVIPYKNPKARLSSASLDRQKQNSSLSNLISYRFVVRTGTQKNSGTRAQVFLYIYGTENNWTSVHLQKTNQSTSSTSIENFPSGSIRTFCLKGPDIGQLHHLNVNLVGSRSEKEWFLKEIEITNLNNSKTWLCEFNCWLPKVDSEQEEIKHTKSTVHLQKDFSLLNKYFIYILQIHTGEKSFAGTDANIQIIIHGSKNQTQRLPLTSNRANLFEQNQLDTFAIIGEDLGDLLEIIVESDRSQFATDWDIKEMRMWRIIPADDQNTSQVYFPFNTWLGKKISTLKSKREIYPVTDHHLKGPICYQITVKTGKIANAGTDANVFLIIYGKSARTVIHQLNNRLKNDFERNSTSEFTIMDIDVGIIDRIKIWHDNSNPGSAWFLDSIIIRKKYSTCSTISNIYVRRLEQISKSLYHQISEQIKKNLNINEKSSIDRQSFKTNDYDDNGSKNRGILRSLTMYDKISLNKKVTWDEQSIGSQDDLFSINSQRSINKQKLKKENSVFHSNSDHFDYQTIWISSHNYTDNGWKIKSIEETNSFDFDQSIRLLLLSDRRSSIINKTSIHENNDDEIYEFQANRWLAKDKEDGKLEIYLTAKLIHKLSNSNIDLKKIHSTSSKTSLDIQQQKYHEDNFKELKRPSSREFNSIEKSSRISSGRLLNTSKLSHHDLQSFQRNIDRSSRPSITLTQHDQSPRINSSTEQRSKSPRIINDLTDSMSSERELLARITNESSYSPRSIINSRTVQNPRLKLSGENLHERESLSKNPNEESINYQRLKAFSTSPRNINNLTISTTNERDLLRQIPEKSSYHSRLSTSDQYIKSSRNNDDLSIRDLSTKMSREPTNYPRSTNQPLKSLYNTKDSMNPLTSEQELLARITGEPSYRSSPSPSLNQRIKSPNTLINSSINEVDSLNYQRSRATPSLSSNPLLNSTRLNKEPTTRLVKAPIEPILRPKSAARSNPNLSPQKSIYDQVYKSAYDTISSNDF